VPFDHVLYSSDYLYRRDISKPKVRNRRVDYLCKQPVHLGQMVPSVMPWLGFRYSYRVRPRSTVQLEPYVMEPVIVVS
jgi:hypothetical protein